MAIRRATIAMTSSQICQNASEIPTSAAQNARPMGQ